MNPKTILTTLLFTSGLLMGNLTHAGQSPGPVQPSVAQPGYQWEKLRGDRAQRLEASLTTLHAALKLKPDQENAWKEWTTKFKGDATHWKEQRQQFESWSKLPVIERMEKKLGFMKEHEQQLAERILATKAFYTTLSSEQRQVFDTQFNPWPYHKGEGDEKDHGEQ